MGSVQGRVADGTAPRLGQIRHALQPSNGRRADGDVRLSQALAHLEETHPDPPLLPGSAVERARVGQIALVAG